MPSGEGDQNFSILVEPPGIEVVAIPVPELFAGGHRFGVCPAPEGIVYDAIEEPLARDRSTHAGTLVIALMTGNLKDFAVDLDSMTRLLTLFAVQEGGLREDLGVSIRDHDTLDINVHVGCQASAVRSGHNHGIRVPAENPGGQGAANDFRLPAPRWHEDHQALEIACRPFFDVTTKDLVVPVDIVLREYVPNKIKQMPSCHFLV